MSQISEEQEQQSDMASLATSDANAKGRQVQAQRGLDGFTPGPWTVDAEAYQGPYIVGGHRAVAQIVHRHAKPLDPVERANATLIASAPDLLAALRNALGALVYVTAGAATGLDAAEIDGLRCYVDQARAAIARATGAS